jgi:hypothetical protein
MEMDMKLHENPPKNNPYQQRTTEEARELRLLRNKANHLGFSGSTTLCGIENTYKGHRTFKPTINPLTLPNLISGTPKALGKYSDQRICAKCWRELMVIIGPAADKAARDAIEAHRMALPSHDRQTLLLSLIGKSDSKVNPNGQCRTMRTKDE